MKYAIDETELARLEALTARHTNVVTLDNVSIPHQIIKAVPALVAEIRRLREDVYALRESFDCEHEALMRHEHMVAELMEKVEAWEWFGECFEAMMWVLRADILNFDGYVEARNSTEYAREEAVMLTASEVAV